MLLDESEKIGKARLASADVFQSRISENAKNTRQAKLQIAKRCFDALRKYQEEVQQVGSVRFPSGNAGETRFQVLSEPVEAWDRFSFHHESFLRSSCFTSASQEIWRRERKNRRQ